MNKFDFVKGWNVFWNSVTSFAPGLNNVLIVVGTLVIVAAIIAFFWQKWRGGGANKAQIGWALAVGMILVAPNVIIPLLLWFFGLAAGLFAGLLQNLGR